MQKVRPVPPLNSLREGYKSLLKEAASLNADPKALNDWIKECVKNTNHEGRQDIAGLFPGVIGKASKDSEVRKAQFCYALLNDRVDEMLATPDDPRLKLSSTPA